ncbi:MAG: cell division protein FtsZ [Verrucomicrobiota bacterium]
MNMESNPETQGAAAEAPRPVRFRIFGLGGAGLQVLGRIAASNAGAALTAVGSADDMSRAPEGVERLALEPRLLRGMGTGGDPERGRAAAEEHEARLDAACAGLSVAFLVAGLGGGSGTGMAPVLARAAKKSGAVVIAIVTLPFECEGNRRRAQAGHGLQELKAAADAVICLPCERLFRLVDESASVVETFRTISGFLADGVLGLWQLATGRGLIEIHLPELCSLLRTRQGDSVLAVAEAAGPTRSRVAVERLLAHPLLDGGKALAGAETVVVSITGGPELSMSDMRHVMEVVGAHTGRAQVLMGATISDRLQDQVLITLVACHGELAGAGRGAADTVDRMASPLDTQPLEAAGQGRAPSRFAAPPPALPPERLEQMVKQSPAVGRPRRGGPKMRQGQLPLEIVSKGRFDKSEPTIHKGEDLDVPTYLRRGVSLN